MSFIQMRTQLKPQIQEGRADDVRMVRAISLITAAATALLFATSCNKETKIINEDNLVQIRFSWWGNEDRNTYTTEAIKTFEKENKNISVTPEYGEYDGLKAKMNLELYSNSEADVMQLDYNWMFKYISNGCDFYDLDQLSKYINLKNFSSEALDSGRVDGKLKGIPATFDTLTFFCNKTLFNHYGLGLPTTWKDYFDAARIMKNDEIYPLALDAKSFWLVCNAANEQATGRTLFDENGNFTNDEGSMLNMISFYISLVEQKVSKNSDQFDISDLENNKVACVPMWITNAQHDCEKALDSRLEIVVGTYPTYGSEVKNYGWCYKPSSFYAVKKNTKNPEAAGKFINYMLNSEEMAVKQGTEKGVPLSASAVETLEGRGMLSGLSYDASKKMSDSSNLKLMNPMLDDDEIIAIFSDVCNSVYYDKYDIPYAAKNACERINEYLKENISDN